MEHNLEDLKLKYSSMNGKEAALNEEIERISVFSLY